MWKAPGWTLGVAALDGVVLDYLLGDVAHWRREFSAQQWPYLCNWRTMSFRAVLHSNTPYGTRSFWRRRFNEVITIIGNPTPDPPLGSEFPFEALRHSLIWLYASRPAASKECAIQTLIGMMNVRTTGVHKDIYGDSAFGDLALGDQLRRYYGLFNDRDEGIYRLVSRFIRQREHEHPRRGWNTHRCYVVELSNVQHCRCIVCAERCFQPTHLFGKCVVAGVRYRRIYAIGQPPAHEHRDRRLERGAFLYLVRSSLKPCTKQ